MIKRILFLSFFLFVFGFLTMPNVSAQSVNKTEELKASIYPSEVRDNHFFIELADGIEITESNIKIVNLLGSEVTFHISKLIDGKYKVELTNIPTGIYIVRVTKDRKQSTQRIVIRNN